MKVAGHRADDHLARRACNAGCQMGFQKLHAVLHGLCRYQHLRNEDLAVFKFGSYLVHSRDHTFVEDLCGITACVKRLCYSCSNFFCFSFYYQIINFLNTCHFCLPPLFWLKFFHSKAAYKPSAVL